MDEPTHAFRIFTRANVTAAALKRSTPTSDDLLHAILSEKTCGAYLLIVSMAGNVPIDRDLAKEFYRRLVGGDYQECRTVSLETIRRMVEHSVVGERPAHGCGLIVDSTHILLAVAGCKNTAAEKWLAELGITLETIRVASGKELNAATDSEPYKSLGFDMDWKVILPSDRFIVKSDGSTFKEESLAGEQVPCDEVVAVLSGATNEISQLVRDLRDAATEDQRLIGLLENILDKLTATTWLVMEEKHGRWARNYLADVQGIEVGSE